MDKMKYRKKKRLKMILDSSRHKELPKEKKNGREVMFKEIWQLFMNQ